MTQALRHPADYAGFKLPDERARNYQLDDRSQANLLITNGRGEMQRALVADLPDYLSAGTVLVLNSSGTYFARFHQVELPSGELCTVHFANMLDEAAQNWVVVVPAGLAAGDRLRLPGVASLELLVPYEVRGQQPSWENWGVLWKARFYSDICFDFYHEVYGAPIQYPYDKLKWSVSELQNCFSQRPTSAMMNNGGRNLTPDVLDNLLTKGVHIAHVEMRTGVGVDGQGMPLPEFVSLNLPDALVINAAIAKGDLVLPVGTGVIRALDWFYHPAKGQVKPGSGWCTNVITPDNGGTWLDAWVSGMHEPHSTHLAMGSAVMGEDLMRASMEWAFNQGFLFHENGDTHVHLPH